MFTPIIVPLVIVNILDIVSSTLRNENSTLLNMKVDNRYITTSNIAIIKPLAPICFPTYIDTIKNVRRVNASSIVLIRVSFSIFEERKVMVIERIKLIKASNNIDEMVILSILIINSLLWWCLIICMSSY